MTCVNEMRVDFLACGENEGFARLCAAAFIMRLNPTVDQMNDIKTAVSEAVTNAIIHGYDGTRGMVRLSGEIFDDNSVAFEVHKNTGWIWTWSAPDGPVLHIAPRHGALRTGLYRDGDANGHRGSDLAARAGH